MDDELRRWIDQRAEAFDILGDPVNALDLAGNIVYVNAACEELFGYSRSELVGEHLSKILPPNGRMIETKAISSTPSGKWVGKVQRLRKNGEVFPVELSVTLITDKEGNAVGRVGIVRDLIEVCKLEEALERQVKLQSLLARIGRTVNSSLELQEVCAAIAREVKTLVPYDRLSINTIDHDDKSVTTVYVDGSDALTGNNAGNKPLAGTTADVLASTSSPMLISSADNHSVDEYPGIRKAYEVGLRSFITVPLLSNDRVIGSLNIRSRTPGVYGEDELDFAVKIGDQIVGAVVNAELHASLQKEAQENDLVARIGRIISESTDINEVFDRFTKDVAKLINFDRLAITSVDMINGTTTNRFVHGFGPSERGVGFVNKLDGSEIGKAIRSQKAMLSQPKDLDELRRISPHRLGVTFQAGLRSTILAPLFARNLPIGCLEIQSKGLKAYGEQDLRLIQRIADQIAGAVFNAQLFEDHLKSEQQLLQAQKMDAVGTLAGGIAHDFNNMLSAILSYAHLASEKSDADTEIGTYVREIQKVGDRSTSLIRQLLAFSRQQLFEPRVVDLNDLVTNMEKMLRRMISENIDVVTFLEKDLRSVLVDPGQMEQVIMNLAVNGRDAMPDGGRLVLETKNVIVDEKMAAGKPDLSIGPYVAIRISDNGIGMTPEVKSHMFDPFYTTKEFGKGTGLGLSTCHGIVTQSSGCLDIMSEMGKGTTAVVLLPAIDEVSERVSDPELPDENTSGHERILLVEDEHVVRRVACKVLEGKGYSMLEAENGVQALEIMATQSEEPIDILLTDVVMPKMGGRELAERFRSLAPNAKILFMTGYTDDDIIRQDILRDGALIIQKPFTPNTLAHKVREVLDSN